MIEPKDPPADPRQNAKYTLVGIGVLLALFLGLVLGPCAKAEPAELPAPLADVRPALPLPSEADPAFLVSFPAGLPSAPRSPHELRVETSRLIVRALYNHPGRMSFLPHVETLVAEHEWYEREGARKGYPYAAGFADAYWYSLVYGGANFALRCYATAPGNCAGPLDVKRWPLVLDPQRNIEVHVAEMWTGQRKGYRGLGLCRYTMYPVRPRDWGGGRFAKTDARHRAVIEQGYREGRLP